MLFFTYIVYSKFNKKCLHKKKMYFNSHRSLLLPTCVLPYNRYIIKIIVFHFIRSYQHVYAITYSSINFFVSHRLEVFMASRIRTRSCKQYCIIQLELYVLCITADRTPKYGELINFLSDAEKNCTNDKSVAEVLCSRVKEAYSHIRIARTMHLNY